MLVVHGHGRIRSSMMTILSLVIRTRYRGTLEGEEGFERLGVLAERKDGQPGDTSFDVMPL